jgi:hypothetical protein
VVSIAEYFAQVADLVDCKDISARFLPPIQAGGTICQAQRSLFGY